MLVHVLRTFTVHVMWGLKDTLVMLATATSYTIGTNQIYINVLTVMAIQIGIKKSMPWHVGEQRQSYASNRFLLTRLLEQPSMFYH